MTFEPDPEIKLGGWADALLTAANLLNGADVDALYASLVPSVDAKQRVRDLALEAAKKHLANFSEPPPHVLMALGAEANEASETIDNDGADTVDQPTEDSSIVVNCHEFSHFFAVAARIVRRRLIDHGLHCSPGSSQLEQTIAIDNLLDELQASHPVWCSIVELKYFVGLTDKETAEVLGLRLRTTRRQFSDARRWLFDKLNSRPCETKPDSFQGNSHAVPDGAATIGQQCDRRGVSLPAAFVSADVQLGFQIEATNLADAEIVTKPVSAEGSEQAVAGRSSISASPTNMQDSFLNYAQNDKAVVTIYLMSGAKLSGRIRSFDKFCLVLETNNKTQLIVRDSISTMVTQKAEWQRDQAFDPERFGRWDSFLLTRQNPSRAGWLRQRLEAAHRRIAEARKRGELPPAEEGRPLTEYDQRRLEILTRAAWHAKLRADRRAKM